MNPKFEQFAHAVSDYPEFKTKFRAFCEESAKALNNNQYLPGVSFAAAKEGTTATIRILDQSFVVRFTVVVLNAARIGVLAVYLPRPNDGEDLLWHSIFDINGNVLDTPDARTAMYHLSEKQFLNKLVGEFTDRYFSQLIEKFKLTAPPRQ